MGTSHEPSAGPPADAEGMPPRRTPGDGTDVDVQFHGDTARIAVSGELTEASRRPLVRAVTDLLLGRHGLQRIDLELSGVTFVSSAGIAVLVQLHKLVAPRAIELVLVAATPAVVRPLQLTGLWHRFTVADAVGAAPREGAGRATDEHG